MFNAGSDCVLSRNDGETASGGGRANEIKELHLEEGIREDAKVTAAAVRLNEVLEDLERC